MKEKYKLEEQEIDLRDVFNFIRKGKWSIFISGVVFALIAVLFAFTRADIYTSSTILAPNESKNSGLLDGLSSQLGGVASLAGINLNESGSGQVNEGLEILRSYQFISNYIKKFSYADELMAHTGWNKKDNTPIFDSDYLAVESKWVKNDDGSSKEPSLQEIFKYFKKNTLRISTEKTTGFITVSINHYSPVVAQEMLVNLIAELNNQMKMRDISEANKNIQFLEKSIESTNISQVKGAIYNLIEQQLQKKMLANARDEYVLKTLDPPIVVEKPSSPKRVLIVIIGMFIGMLFGFLFHSYKMFARTKN
ncbi:LPS O-antigen length regulator [Pseudoalteromonas sp. SR44-5]|uniref:Wzz/FepE/Etk N-terminal domain-containing protein n=1 Tax=Pseudoalteromonas rhizosphaerae TaxID=2518973 RepID=A0ABW8KTN3_9GAMM|nr:MULTISPECIES: Wzz/FepE/Etk N-terminal domain-containing protein [unclassified Pseudoalteromonas]MBB1368444.1 LPS O-antigen length regulator [Pseudoalteromonas sp. SR44-5]MBB1481811.1 LPS O-antigen length regulator [Pseudoalteromonas sp. SG41-2]